MVLPWSLCQKSMGLVFVGLAVESLLFTILVHPSDMAHGPGVRGFAGCPLSRGVGVSPILPIFSKMAFPFPGPWHFQVDLKPPAGSTKRPAGVPMGLC